MVILGLGSNVGDRMANLRKALIAIRQIPGMIVEQVSPVYLSDALLPENAPPEWDMPHLNLALRCHTTLEPLDLLDQLKKIEWSIGRKPEVRHWGPRILDVDILAWNSDIIKSERLTVPHESLQERPFALWPLADVAPDWRFPLNGPYHDKTAAEIGEQWGSRFTGNAPLRARQIYQRIDTPQLMGVVNVTPDSFSDGGAFLEAEKALQQALYLVYSGAEIIDIGAESTAPSAKPLTADIEWQRLEPVLAAIQAAKDKFMILPKISIDTRHSEVAAKALKQGVDWINDVTGLEDEAMRELVCTSKADCVVMHHMSIPASRQHVLPRHQDPVRLVYEWGAKQIDVLEKAGISRERIIFDPGIGFGKVAEHSLQLIRHTDVFKQLGTRVLIGHSRKSFLSLFTPHTFAERDIETLSIALYLAKQPVDYLRVHNVEMCARGFRVQAAL
ncbi:dihydropteroate synthase [Aquicella lusitana]|uniref:2-amino-4-hydroxy-6-hydroxymethyldihydropteridine diphosphokinase/dihydropteroate synthase n=1 Tax=Aquicella lusitana TaxID=254246 RepID=A0A370GDP7_9COXI|nr:dihydropteroate synthase [Aquicella lusitana]RDI41346.1 2-amino-4-hydroxy-6-hydroxymethyldihydropteridine diphosphokinase/dihydropteroate synthase [Aquicella lusitana]VVC74263.1 Dihydropteroate synthase [Aquicella lusitana]